MSIIKVTLLYAMLQMCSCIGQSVFGPSSLKLAKTVATKTDCAILYTCLTCVSSTVFLYFSDTLVTYQTTRCYKTHNHNMCIIQMLLKTCEIPMIAHKTLIVLGDKWAPSFSFSRISNVQLRPNKRVLAAYTLATVTLFPREATQHDTLLFRSGFISRGTPP